MHVGKRAIDGAKRRLLDMRRVWPIAIGLSHCFFNLGSGETLGFKKLDTLCQRRGLGLDDAMRRFNDGDMSINDLGVCEE